MRETKHVACLLFVVLTLATAASGQSYWTAERQKELVRTLESYTQTPFRRCVKEARGVMNVFTLTQVSLAGTAASPQYHLVGKKIDGKRETCGYGIGAPMHFMIEEDGRSFRVLADIGAADSVTLLDSTHSGYRDLRTVGTGKGRDTNILMFDGITYK